MSQLTFNPLPEDSVPLDYALAGTSGVPRLRRIVRFPVSTSPITPGVTSTLTQLPFFRPPPHIMNDPVIRNVIDSHPELFAVSCPINAPLFRAMLLHHPNQLLVNSVCEGLIHGFWPLHNGFFNDEFSNIITSNTPEDNIFLSDVADKDFEKGYLSEHFTTLLPGMHTSPSFVVRVANRKPRGVVDQSASRLNDGIPKHLVKTTYDTITHFLQLIRFVHRSGASHVDSVLWKSDVSGAFRNIPVCREWQLKQIHRVVKVDKNVSLLSLQPNTFLFSPPVHLLRRALE